MKGALADKLCATTKSPDMRHVEGFRPSHPHPQSTGGKFTRYIQHGTEIVECVRARLMTTSAGYVVPTFSSVWRRTTTTSGLRRAKQETRM